MGGLDRGVGEGGGGGVRAWGLGSGSFGVHRLGYKGFRGFRGEGSEFRVLGLKFLGLGFRVQGSGFRVQGLGFRVQGYIQGYLAHQKTPPSTALPWAYAYCPRGVL